MSEPMTWRPEVRAFADAMERRLRANDWKGGWQNENVWHLLGRLRGETYELEGTLPTVSRPTGPGVLDEAADVANFALMIADVCGGLTS